MTTARFVALEVLERVFFDDAYSHIALSNALEDTGLSDRDHRLATELVYGVLARKRTLDAVLEQFVDRPLDQLDRPVVLALRLAAYQLLFLDRIPAHAAVDESVEMTKKRCGRGAGGFTNGVLRSMLRNKDDWSPWHDYHPREEPVRHLGVRHSLPDWIAERLIDEHGFEKAAYLAASFNERPPLYLRVLDDPPDPMVAELPAVDEVPGAFRAESMTDEIKASVQARRLTIQDLGSQLVGHYCTPGDHTRILDACAGQGGKTLQLGYLTDRDTTIVAVEPHRSKLDRLVDTAESTTFAGRIEPFHGPIEQLDDDEASEPFDLVVVDAPCSGLGVIRRHPETRWRRTPEDVADRARLQSKLLDDAADHVAEGGLLVYAVCSFTREEGPQRIEAFLDDHPDFQREPPASDTGVDWTKFTDDRGDLKVNPLDHDTDAFYAARLRRTPRQ